MIDPTSLVGYDVEVLRQGNPRPYPGMVNHVTEDGRLFVKQLPLRHAWLEVSGCGTFTASEVQRAIETGTPLCLPPSQT